jgi:hypothetical protein
MAVANYKPSSMNNLIVLTYYTKGLQKKMLFSPVCTEKTVVSIEIEKKNKITKKQGKDNRLSRDKIINRTRHIA